MESFLQTSKRVYDFKKEFQLKTKTMIKKILNKVIFSVTVLMGIIMYGQVNVSYYNFATLKEGPEITAAQVQQVNDLYYKIHYTLYVNPEGVEVAKVEGESKPQEIYFNHTYANVAMINASTEYSLDDLKFMEIRWDGTSANTLTSAQKNALAEFISKAQNLQYVMVTSEKYNQKLSTIEVQNAFSDLIQLLQTNAHKDILMLYYVLGEPQ